MSARTFVLKRARLASVRFRSGDVESGRKALDRAFAKHPDEDDEIGIGLRLRLERELAGRAPWEIRRGDPEVTRLRALWDDPRWSTSPATMQLGDALSAMIDDGRPTRENIAFRAEAAKRWEQLPEEVRDSAAAKVPMFGGRARHEENLLRIALHGRSAGLPEQAHPACRALLARPDGHRFEPRLRREYADLLAALSLPEPGAR